MFLFNTFLFGISFGKQLCAWCEKNSMMHWYDKRVTKSLDVSIIYTIAAL